MKNMQGEREVAELWRRQDFRWEETRSEEGDIIEVISPGQINDEQGPDFRNAVIRVNGDIRRGDVEIHVRTSGWREHGHDKDPAYNGLVLHVVMYHDAGVLTRLQNGAMVPVLALNRYAETGAEERDGRDAPCAGLSGFHTGDLLNLLDEAGTARFREKAARFEDAMSWSEPGQVLYSGLMGALGYSRNKMPFLELAGRLPLATLETALNELPEERFTLCSQFLLLGAAGLPGDSPPGVTEECRAELSRVEVMSPQDWHFMKVRPCNSPVRRLLAMSRLLLRYRDKGLLTELTGLVTASEGWQALEKGLVVNVPGPGPALLGKGRAREMVINILLPFTVAWNRRCGSIERARRAFDLYLDYPAAEMNSIESLMAARLGLARRELRPARRRQGLIHLYRKWCRRGACERCFLGQLQSGGDIHIQAVPLPGDVAEVAAGGYHGGVIGAES